MKKLFLLDAYALIFRAYFAFARNPRVTSKGLDTSAVYGFLLALLDVITGPIDRAGNLWPFDNFHVVTC